VTYLERHPEWPHQFEKYKVEGVGELSPDKVLLTSLVITEGFVDPHTIGFTNTQHELREAFRNLVCKVYGGVKVGQSGILSRLSSVQVAKDVGLLMEGKAFSDKALRFILAYPRLCAQVSRVVADTEGSMIISLRRAPRNFTVECRVVLATTNRRFALQLCEILANIGISSTLGTNGVTIGRKRDILRFNQIVGFTPGVKVVRTKAGVSTWLGKEKARLGALCRRIYSEQSTSKRRGLRGCFAGCLTKSQLVARLDAWYDETAEVMT
jgi:hypothetical protein